MSLKLQKKSRGDLKSLEDKILYYMNGLFDEMTDKELEIADAVQQACDMMQERLFFKERGVQRLMTETGKSRPQCYKYFAIAEYVLGEKGMVSKKAMRVLIWNEHLCELELLHKKRKKAKKDHAQYAHYSALIRKHLEAVTKLFNLDKEDNKELEFPEELYNLPDISFTTDPKALEINKETIEDAETVTNE